MHVGMEVRMCLPLYCVKCGYRQPGDEPLVHCPACGSEWLTTDVNRVGFSKVLTASDKRFLKSLKIALT